MSIIQGWIMRCIACGLLVSVCAPLATGQSAESPPESIHSLQTRFLILRTGGVYAGHLELDGGQYVIRRDNGASVRFHQGEVDFVADSMQSAYQRLHSRLEPDDVLGHQRLANWCMRNREFNKARKQLDILRRISRNSSTIRLLERQLANLERSVDEPTTQPTLPREELPPGIRRLPRTGLPLATREELEELLDSFSRQSLREFTTSIHNRIVNGCAAARCHGDAGASMRLWRVDNRGGLTSTGVQRNLHAISRFLDRSNPQASPLLQYTSQVHGGMKSPAYDATSHHYHAIRDWVMTTAIDGLVPEVAENEEITQTSFLDEPAVAPPTAALPTAGDLPPSPVDLLSPTERFVPRDEFDPEIFNRKYGNPPPSAPPERLLPEQPATNPRSRPVRSLPPLDDR